MESNNNLSLGQLAGALAGAGLTQINTDIVIAFSLIGVGVAIEVLRAVLHSRGIEISSGAQG